MKKKLHCIIARTVELIETKPIPMELKIDIVSSVIDY
jgi:hypothetical protein